MSKRIAAGLIWILALGTANATEYFVSRDGDDSHDGTSQTAAFATIQKGVDALQPGDTLTILPGEYREHVRREKIGSQEKETRIRAHIPGTVILRGDVPAPEFRRATGREYVYVADFEGVEQVTSVNELDTLTMLELVPNASEPQYIPGAFHYDAEAGKLYVSSSDWRPPSEHRYTVSVTPTHGLYLSEAQRVTIEGLTVTGYKATEEQGRYERTLLSTWGLFLAGAKNCVVRDCKAYLNGQGIGINSLARPGYRPGEFGGNAIERCVAWGNVSNFGSGDRGGISLIQTYQDTVRDSVAFLNGDYGINIRSGSEEEDGSDKSVLLRNLAWGNGGADIKIKTGYDNPHATVRSVAMHPSNDYDPEHCLLGSANPGEISASNIVLEAEENLDMNEEFADPENRDYHLQSTSRFRGALPGGGDKGPFPYEANIFYVGPNGDDSADGLSIAGAWRTLERATRDLRPSDTLYLEHGDYAEGLDVRVAGEEERPVSIRGRGLEPVNISGPSRLVGVQHLDLRRLSFRDAVTVEEATAVRFRHCRFSGRTIGLGASGTDGLDVRNCAFEGFGDAGIALENCKRGDLRGNLYENRRGVGVRIDAWDALLYSGDNAYRRLDAAWGLAGRTVSAADAKGDMRPRAAGDAVNLATSGAFARPAGPYRDSQPSKDMRLVQPPSVFSASAETANIEWRTSLPALCEVRWGETPECENTESFHADRFGTFSLTGLKPDTTYYFRLASLRIPSALTDDINAEPVELEGEALSFATSKSDAPPRTLHVAPDGDDGASGLDRDHAWRTIQHAAGNVRPGDTVLIAGGTYVERVRMRVTGSEDAPIAFACAPGEKVHLDGAGKRLNRAFIAAGKAHLRFDGFYFKGFNREPLHSSNWKAHMAGNFNLHKCKDIRITRCFADGRGGYSARFVIAWFVEDLFIANSVVMNKMSGSMILQGVPGLRMEHTVICRPMITSFHLHSVSGESAVMERNIFADMLRKKARLNIPMFYGSVPEMRDNCYFVREFSPEERHLYRDRTAAELTERIHAPLFADPKFAGDPDPDAEGFPPDRITHPAVDLDFDSFFATNPDVAERGIGLQKEAFEDFDFERKGE